MWSNAAAILAVFSAVCAPAAADTITLGSDLTADATVTETHGADTAFWPAAIEGREFAVPKDGQIVLIRLKGMAVPATLLTAKPPPPTERDRMVHFQTLSPLSNGAVRIELTSGAFYVPAAGDPNQISEFRPENLCAKRGQLLDFNTVGGFNPPFYPNGTPLRVFGAVRTSNTAHYEKVDATGNGDTMYANNVAGQELLMQYVLTTGYDASPLCGGTTRPPPGNGEPATPPGNGEPAPAADPKVSRMRIHSQRAYVRVNRRVEPTAYCPRDTGGCRGEALLKLGSTALTPTVRFSAPAGRTAHIRMRLTPGAYRSLVRRPRRAQRARLIVRAATGTVSRAITIRH